MSNPYFPIISSSQDGLVPRFPIPTSYSIQKYNILIESMEFIEYNTFMKKLSPGTVHKIPEDLKNTLLSNNKLSEIWESLTPLARNEWICWITSPKKIETRSNHLKRIAEELSKGKRRPCCWSGCIHR